MSAQCPLHQGGRFLHILLLLAVWDQHSSDTKLSPAGSQYSNLLLYQQSLVSRLQRKVENVWQVEFYHLSQSSGDLREYSRMNPTLSYGLMIVRNKLLTQQYRECIREYNNIILVYNRKLTSSPIDELGHGFLKVGIAGQCSSTWSIHGKPASGHHQALSVNQCNKHLLYLLPFNGQSDKLTFFI